MAVTIQLPADIEQRLRAQTPDLDAELKEAVALDLFRRGKLSHYELSKMLGLDRFETDAYLKRHNVVEGSLTMQDLTSRPKRSIEFLARRFADARCQSWKHPVDRASTISRRRSNSSFKELPQPLAKPEAVHHLAFPNY